MYALKIAGNNSEQVEQYDTFPYALHVPTDSTPVLELSEEARGTSIRRDG